MQSGVFEFKAFNLLSFFVAGAVVVLTGCSDGSSKNALTDATAKDTQVASESIPLFALGRDGALVVSNDFTFPDDEYEIIFDDQKILIPRPRSLEDLATSKTVCSFKRRELSVSTLKKDDELAVKEIEAEIIVSAGNKISAKQEITFKNKNEKRFVLICLKPFRNVQTSFVTVKEFRAVAGQYFNVSDLKVDLPAFGITETSPSEDSLFSKIAPGSTIRTNDIPDEMKFLKIDPTSYDYGKWFGYWRNGNPDTVASANERLATILGGASGQNTTINSVVIEYSLEKYTSSISERVRLKLVTPLWNLTWSTPTTSTKKSLSTNDLMSEFYPNSVLIDGSALPFSVFLR